MGSSRLFGNRSTLLELNALLDRTAVRTLPAVPDQLPVAAAPVFVLGGLLALEAIEFIQEHLGSLGA